MSVKAPNTSRNRSHDKENGREGKIIEKDEKRDDFPEDFNTNITKAIVYKESRFWQIMNKIELPMIIILQKIFFIHKTYNFFNDYFSRIASSKWISYGPLILLCLLSVEESRLFMKGATLYALLSSFGKNIFIRRRPGSFHGVYIITCPETSSFPSRHTMAASIIASFTPIRNIIMIGIIIDRLVIGFHFLTDCLFGMVFGYTCIFLAETFDDTLLYVVLAALSIFIWKGGCKIIGGCIPICCLCIKNKPSILCFPLIFMRGYIVDLTKNYFKAKKDPFVDAILILLAQSITLYAILNFDKFLQYLVAKNYLSESIYGFDIREFTHRFI